MLKERLTLIMILRYPVSVMRRLNQVRDNKRRAWITRSGKGHMLDEKAKD
jgi:hypothetical protein